MTRIGYVCMIVLLGLSLTGLIACSVKQKRSQEEERRWPKVGGEPVVFRTAEMRVVKCRVSMELMPRTLKDRGLDPNVARDLEQEEQYCRRMLAYKLADRMLEEGVIQFEHSGTTLRAEAKAVTE